MPLIFEEGRTPSCWADRNNVRPAGLDGGASPPGSLSIALINNMPDPALEDTEFQFFELLDSAAGKMPIRVKLYSLPELQRSERAQQHLKNFYFDINDLWNSRLDGVIITGTEPRRPDLRNEPYWGTLVDILEWAENNTASTILSCLAAHASVLHSDGIVRSALTDKRFGVFDHRIVGDHELTSGAADPMPIPQSRWNEVREDALISSGYTILTRSLDGAADLFVKMKKKSLFVHFQGHPEYGARTLLKEYRRDIRRFLGRERETYPSMPHGYFDRAAAKVLNNFRAAALTNPQEELLAAFPETAVADTLQCTWNSSATRMYRNWLQYLGSRKSGAHVHPAMARASHE
jgi:homoserine O-succinyltransferase